MPLNSEEPRIDILPPEEPGMRRARHAGGPGVLRRLWQSMTLKQRITCIIGLCAGAALAGVLFTVMLFVFLFAAAAAAAAFCIRAIRRRMQ